MKIIVVGNMGYVGPSLVRQLRSEYPNGTLIGYDIGYFAHCLTAPDLLPEAHLDTQVFGDIRAFPVSLLRDVDVVVNLAAISNDPMGNAFEGVTMDINHRGCVELARSARQAGVKSFVFASSCSMYGSAEDRPRNEDSELNPLTAYARSKVAAERDLKEIADESFTVTALRFATACGMSDRLRLDLVLNDFVAGAFAAKKITILSDGTPWRPLIDVEDMGRAFRWAITRPANGRFFLGVNVGRQGSNFQVRQLAEAVAGAIPGVAVDINESAAPDKRSYQVDFSLFRELAPEHQPEKSLGDSIAGLLSGLQQIQFRDTNFRTSTAMRLVQINLLREQGLLNENLQWRFRR